ncbi:transcriptional regulator with XRE-family HTH domain [Mucilaginibacter sp. UYP25]|uniref:helix-turn-helix domain-containing protein n=1 Tax=unclassified Mucilaginibacter TaxID=2617802 RepID=UPI0033969972
MAETTLHIGRKISRIRELRGMKQEALAAELGISQQAVSKIEQSVEVEETALDKIAAALGVSVSVIKNFDDQKAINLFNNIYNNQFHENSTAFIYQQFNPIEKVIELYERLLASEREKIELIKNK